MPSDKYDVLFIHLNGKNHSAWAFQFQILVKGKNLWGHGDDTSSAPNKENHPNKYAMWESRTPKSWHGS